MARRKNNFAGFLGISLIIHGLLFWAWQAESVPALPLGHIEVQLRQVASSSTTNSANQSTQTDNTVKSVPDKQDSSRLQPSVMQISNAQPADHAVEDPLHVQLQGKIRSALTHYLTYPVRARRYGWEGTVTVRLVVQANGNLGDIALVRSSGFLELDNSAIDALRNVHRLEELVPLLDGERVTLELPITYKLTG